MTAVGRAFVAVEPPEPVRAAIAEHVRMLQEHREGARVRFTEGWHLTLQFLGRVEDPDEVAAALHRALRDARGPDVRLGGGGGFPRARRGTLLWIGVDRGADGLEELAGVVSGATLPLGFAAEARRFHPHVTIARSRAPIDLRPFAEALGNGSVGPSWHVDDLVLLSSETRPEGARYTEIGRLPLA